MNCPFCHAEDSKVIDSRPIEEGTAIRRRRECVGCLKRFTTYEKVEEMAMVVVKRDGGREVFNKNKILNGLLKACEKRCIPMDVLNEMVNDIELELRNLLKQEIPSRIIGEAVMKRLKEVDSVAYVRFASVYRHFEDIDHFILELEKLNGEKKSEV